MSQKLIPFALDDATREFVEVGSVARGRECGCICPSCKTPLIARQGQIVEWHFAHDIHQANAQTIRRCTYSFEVSIRLMIQQFFAQGLELQTPPIIHRSDEYLRYFGRRSITVKNKSTVHCEVVQIGEKFDGVVVDVLTYIDAIPLAVYITHRNRRLPAQLYTPQVEKSGVVELNTDHLAGMLGGARGGQYKVLLQRWLQSGYIGKKWIYHPADTAFHKTLDERRREFERQQQAVQLRIEAERHATAQHQRVVTESDVTQLTTTIAATETDSYQAPGSNDSHDNRHQVKRRRKKRPAKKPAIELPKFRLECQICHRVWQGNNHHCESCGMPTGKILEALG